MTSPAPDFGSGLIPAIVQDASDGSIRMLGMMNAEAWHRSLATGKVHFWSRSRQRLWMKGETSGNTLTIRSINLDCDADAILIRADAAGPTCHQGTRSCFDTTPILPEASDSVSADQPGNQTLGLAVDTLVQTVANRRSASPETSYTAQLLADADFAARKVLEEAGEVAFAAKDHEPHGDPTRIVEETADLLYHLVALLGAHDVDARQVAAELERRRA